MKIIYFKVISALKRRGENRCKYFEFKRLTKFLNLIFFNDKKKLTS